MDSSSIYKEENDPTRKTNYELLTDEENYREQTATYNGKIQTVGLENFSINEALERTRDK